MTNLSQTGSYFTEPNLLDFILSQSVSQSVNFTDPPRAHPSTGGSQSGSAAPGLSTVSQSRVSQSVISRSRTYLISYLSNVMRLKTLNEPRRFASPAGWRAATRRGRRGRSTLRLRDGLVLDVDQVLLHPTADFHIVIGFDDARATLLRCGAKCGEHVGGRSLS